MRRRLWAAVIIGAAVGLTVVLGFRPFVVARLQSRARALGARVEVAHVAPTWAGVRLRGVRVEIDDVPGLTVEVGEMVVGWTSQRPQTIRGVRVRAVGAVGELWREVESWRGKYLASSGAEGSHLELPPVDIDWQDAVDDPEAEVHASGVSLERPAGLLRVAVSKLAGRLLDVSFTADGFGLALTKGDGAYRVAELTTASLTFGLDSDSLAKVASGAGLPRLGPEPSPPNSGATPSGTAASAGSAAPVASGKASHPSAGATEAAVPQPDESSLARLRRAAMLRRGLVSLAEKIDSLLASDARVRLEGMRASVALAGERLLLGPGALTIERSEGSVVVALVPDGDTSPAASGEGHDAGETREPSLTFSLRVPLQRASDQSLAVEVRGGPVHLSTLGIREGELGLRDVERASVESEARVVLSADAEVVKLDGHGKLHGVGFFHPKIAGEPLRGMDLAWSAEAEGRLDGSALRVEAAEIDLGELRLLVHGSYQHGEGHALDLTFEVPLVSCQRAFESLPASLVPTLEGMRFAGTVSIKGAARFDTARIDKDYAVDWDGSNSCRVVHAPVAVDVQRFHEPFRKVVYAPDGHEEEVEFGPGTPGWAPYRGISRYMEGAVLTTEDGRFFRHKGFDKEAIVNSIRENLKVGRFQRGASTISMQLAKNLYLRRTKTISRKLEELVLTMYLEQELTKQEMMELYLNVVEFGPMVYGVGPAARHYFHTSAAGLSLGQAMYLSSVLPSPLTHHFGAGGAVSPGWMRKLRSYMKVLHRIKRISDEELDQGLRETVVYGSPSAMSPPDDADAGGITPSEGADPYGDDDEEQAPTWAGPDGP